MRNVAVFGQRWLNRGRPIPLERWLPVKVKEYPGAKRGKVFIAILKRTLKEKSKRQA